MVRLPQTGSYVGPNDPAEPAVECVYVLADRLDDTEVYQYQPPAPEATN